MVCVHGPVDSRCPGSRKPPGQTTPRDDPAASLAAVTTTTPVSPDDSTFPELITQRRVKILKRIPRSSRVQSARKMAAILEEVTSLNDLNSWRRLFNFASRCLRTPTRGGRRRSLANLVNTQLAEEHDPPVPQIRNGRHTVSDGIDYSKLAARISAKLEEGDFRGAIRLACSEDSIAPDNEDTTASLRLKHLAPHQDTNIPPPPEEEEVKESLRVDEGVLIRAICSFPKGSAGGIDGLRPQHLRDMTGGTAGEGRGLLLRALVNFTNLVLAGKTPEEVRPSFFGANLIALNKSSGGVRPIAVGCTLRRLVAKTASMAVMDRMGTMLGPLQLGYGVRQGAEAAVHAARLYLENLPPNHVLLKLDFKNAFNSVRRDRLLEAARQWVP